MKKKVITLDDLSNIICAYSGWTEHEKAFKFQEKLQAELDKLPGYSGEVEELVKDLKDWMIARLNKIFLSNTAIKEIKELLKKYEVSND